MEIIVEEKKMYSLSGGENMASDSSKPKIVVEEIESGWTIGYVRYNGNDYGFSMKNFIEPSVFGINNGCISKLRIVDGKANRELLVNYDRGWDIKPQTESAKKVYRALLSRFNRSMPEEYVQDWLSGKKVIYPKKDFMNEHFAVYNVGADGVMRQVKKTSKKKTAKTNALREIWDKEF